MGRRQPVADEPCHSLPRDASLLASSPKHVVPGLANSEAKVGERVPIARHSVVPDVSAQRTTFRAVGIRAVWKTWRASAGPRRRRLLCCNIALWRWTLRECDLDAELSMRLIGLLLIIGHGFKATGVLLVALGLAVTVFGLLPSMDFYTELPSRRGIVRKPVSRWSGRLWFVAGGALLIYLGVTHWRP